MNDFYTKNKIHNSLERIRILEEEETEDVDPAALVGDLRGAVDLAKGYLDTWAKQVEFFQEKIDEYKKGKERYLKKIDKMESFIAAEMISKKYEMLPGNAYIVRVKDNKGEVVPTTEIGATEFNDFPEYIVQKTEYHLNKKAVRQRIMEGGICHFAEIVPGYHIQFYSK